MLVKTQILNYLN